MECVVCPGENVEVREVKEPIEMGPDILYVTVTVPTCQSCGERYYDRKTIKYLESVEAEVRAGGGKVHQVGKVLTYG